MKQEEIDVQKQTQLEAAGTLEGDSLLPGKQWLQKGRLCTAFMRFAFSNTQGNGNSGTTNPVTYPKSTWMLSTS